MKNLFLLVPQMDYGGQERFVATLSKILQYDYSVKIITYVSREVGYETACEVINLIDIMPERSNTLIRKLMGVIDRRRALRKLYREYNPVACISFGGGANRLNVEARKKGIKVFISLRTYTSVKQYSSSALDKFTICQADGVLCVSEQIKDELIKVFPKQISKFRCLYNAYDLKSIAKENVLPRKSDGDGKIHIMSLGRVCKEKGYWHLIKALSIVKNEVENVVLDIYGTFQRAAHKELLDKLINDLNLNDSVIFHGNTDKPYAELWSSDIYVLSSITEGFPNALVEAMACGLPVIANDCKSGPREILACSEIPTDKYIVTSCGIITPMLSSVVDINADSLEHEEGILADAILTLCKNNPLRELLSHKGQERVKYYSYEACRNKIIEIVG